MKAQTSMIPLAALLLILLESMGLAMVPPKTKTNSIMNPSDIVLEMRDARYPILSNKNYQYTEETTIEQNEDVIMFIFENIAVATLTVDQEGNYSSNVEYMNEEATSVEEEKPSALESFRQHTHEFFEMACDTVFHRKQNEETQEALPEPTQQDKKYFKSDYEQL